MAISRNGQIMSSAHSTGNFRSKNARSKNYKDRSLVQDGSTCRKFENKRGATQVAVIDGIFVIGIANGGKKSKDGEKPSWAKKDIRDYNEADLERLLDQWDEDEDPLPEDELPEHLRKPPPIDFSKVDASDPENLLKMSKKGKTIMTFVQVSGDPTRNEAEDLTKLWQSALWNNHIQAERFMVDDNRAIFMFRDGSQAWEAKNFLIEQERCLSVTIENKVYPGIAHKDKVDDKASKKKPKNKKPNQEL